MDTLHEESTRILKDEIIKRKKEKNIVVLAHYYVPKEVQEVADYIGDSYYLSKVGREIPEKILCYCGVSFMGESGKILNPEKKVIMPDLSADCPMAHMYNLNEIIKLKEETKDLALVCYVNSSDELKAISDVCVTSANAEKVVNGLSNRNIYFVPDKNLGGYIGNKSSNKNFILNEGFCPIHNKMTVEDVKREKELHPKAEFLVHPECKMEVVSLADYAGSTSGIISYVEKSKKDEFIIGTELGVSFQLEKNNPKKRCYPLNENLICPGMKKNNLESLLQCIDNMEGHEIKVDDDIRNKALKSLEKMLELSK